MPRRPQRPWQRDEHDRTPGPKSRRGVRSHRVDLHGFDVETACTVAVQAVRDAYANGYQSVELVHGARDVTESVAPGGGRGAIKWELRRMLRQGHFDAFCAGQDMLEGSINLRLRPNPQPRSEEWSDLPRGRFSN